MLFNWQVYEYGTIALTYVSSFCVTKYWVQRGNSTGLKIVKVLCHCGQWIIIKNDSKYLLSAIWTVGDGGYGMGMGLLWVVADNHLQSVALHTIFFLQPQQRHHGQVPSNSSGVPSPSASPGARRTPPHDMSKQGVRHSGQQPMSVNHQQALLYRMQPQAGQMHSMVSKRNWSRISCMPVITSY